MELAITFTIGIHHDVVADGSLRILNSQMGRIAGFQIGNQGFIHGFIGLRKQLAIRKAKAAVGFIRLIHRKRARALRSIDLPASRATGKNQGCGQYVGQLFAALEDGIDGI